MRTATVYVEFSGLWDGVRGDSTKPFSNLGRAFQAAEPGDVIRIGPGRFERKPYDIQIGKSLTILGSGMNDTVLWTDHVSTKEGEIYTLLGSHLPNMVKPGTKLEIRDLAIECNGSTNAAAGARQQGLQAHAEEVYINRVRVRGVMSSGAGIEAFGIAARGKRLWVEDCIVENDLGVYMTGIMAGGRDWDGSHSIIVRGNHVDGFDNKPSVGIGLGHAAHAIVTGNTIRRVSAGVMNDTGGVRNVIVANNLINGGAVGVAGFYLAYFSSSNIRFNNNIVEGFEHGGLVSNKTAVAVNKQQTVVNLDHSGNTFVDCVNEWRTEYEKD